MKRYMKIKKAAKGVIALIAFAFVMMSATSAYAAESKIVLLQDALGNGEEAAAEGEQQEEFYLPAEEDDTYDAIEYGNPELELICPLLDAEEQVAFEWTVSPNVRFVSPDFHVEAGQVIVIAADVVPSSSLFWIGIQDSWNSVRYVQGYAGAAHEFEIEKSGNYRVLVQNRSKVTISAVGSYCYFTPSEETEEPEEPED